MVIWRISERRRNCLDLCNISWRLNSYSVKSYDSILPVLIVGAGPVGLVLSILLTKLGVKCAILEKNKAFSTNPQAHFINNRSMEVFRKLDGLGDEILRSQPPVEFWRKFIYCTSPRGHTLGVVDYMQPQELADINVMYVKPWVIHAEVAEKFLSCNNRIILAGDAAHRFPPAGGFGMNTGIQDAHNLAWKLSSVIKGISPISILNSYELERSQYIEFLITVGSVLPSLLQRTILDGIFSIGRAQLSDFVLNENNNPLGSAKLAKLRQIFEGGQRLQLQFPSEDLGFRYRKGALVSEDDSDVLNVHEAPTGRRRDYIPCSEPGSPLPHMTVKLLSNPSIKQIFSTLDLVSGDKVEFVLIIAPLKESYCLARAALEVANKFKVPLKVCVMWPSGSIDGSGSSEAALTPWKSFEDVVERGAILVRPDEHVAWRIKSSIADPIMKMKNVFHVITGVGCI
ncbi:unnamed protein product [Withania somnifera]